MQINQDYFEDLNENNFKELLFNLKNGISVKKGSQIKRQSSEPVSGKNNA